MKKTYFLSILILFVFLSACQEAGDKAKTFTLTNTSVQPLEKATTILPKQLLMSILPKKGQYFTVKQGDKVIPYQFDDLNNDGQADELVIMDDFAAGESKEYTITTSATQPSFKKFTNIHFAYKAKPGEEMNKGTRLTPQDTEKSPVFQMEGPAWENDKVAFRNYFDQRNGIDIFGKQTSKMVLDKVGIEGQNYHALSDWGMDILKVGASLGAGSIALMKGDKVYRIDGGHPSTFEIVSEGPLRSVFDLKFKDFTIDNHKYQIVHRITIEAGKNYYQSDVTVHGLTGDESLITGIVNLHSDSLNTFKTGNMEVLFSHAQQTENKDMLGMALMIPAGQFMGIAKAPEKGDGVVSTYMARMKLEDGKNVRFYFFSGWERQDKAFHDIAGFKKAVKDAADQLQQAIEFKMPTQSR